VNQAGGYIWATSEPAKEHVPHPASRATELEMPAAEIEPFVCAPTEEGSGGGGETILLIEDETAGP
jgi:hypothetical protein